MMHSRPDSLTLARGRAALAAGALAFAAACGGQRGTNNDAALQNDLSLAHQAPPAQQVVSPQELTPGQPGTAAYAPGAAVTTAAPRDTVTKIVYRDRPVSRSHHSSGGSGDYSAGSSGGQVVQSEGHVVRQNNTKRDAIIGGAAGAAIGAATSRDKLKGGLLGAVIGGALGGVVGNNVDVQHKRVP